MKISVIIPIYKVEKFLDACVESVVKQTYKDLEIILVDDGSPDNCPAMCDEWAKRDNRIKVIHKVNGGLSSARNAGLDIATGEYISFIDSDDSVSEQMFEILLDALKKENSDMSMASWQKVKENKKPKNKIYNLEKLDYINFEDDDIFDLLFNKKISLIMTAWAKLYKAEIFKTLRYKENKIHEDEFLMHYVFDKLSKMTYVNLPLYNYTIRSSSIINKGLSLKRLDAVAARKDRWEFCAKNKPEFEQKALSQYLITTACYYTKFKKAKADSGLLKSLNDEFEEKYKLLKNKNIFVKIFKYCKPLFGVILNIKEKILDK